MFSQNNGCIIERYIISALHVGMWRSSNSNSAMSKLQTFSTDSKFDRCFKRLVECEFVTNPCFTTDFILYAQTARECRETFSQIQLYHPSDVINASICIRIHIPRILKVRIRIRLMQIFTSFVTSLIAQDWNQSTVWEMSTCHTANLLTANTYLSDRHCCVYARYSCSVNT